VPVGLLGSGSVRGRSAGALLGLSLIGAGCGAPATPGGPTVPTGAGTPPPATAPANDPNQPAGTPQPPPNGDSAWEEAYGPPEPVDVGVELSPITLTSPVTVEHGGFLSLVGTDGTFFQFEVPAQAVVSDVDITITLVSAISGSPLGNELVGAVAFEPEGLVFLQPATLTIMPAQPIAVDEEGPFSANGDGTDFHLYPLDTDPTAIRMHVFHFSLFGLFKTDAERRAEMIRRTARDVEAQLSQQIQKELSEERQRQLLGASDDTLSTSLDIPFNYYHDRVLRPLLALAENDHTLFIEATQKWLAWERQRQLLGTSDDDDWTSGALWQSWQRGAENYYRHQVDRCYQHDLGAIVDLLAIERANQLLGIAPEAGGDAIEQAEKCATFTLEMDSRTDSKLRTCVIGAGRINQSAHITAKVEIRAFDSLDGQGPWVGPIQWQSADAYAKCEMLSADVATCEMRFAGLAEAGQFVVLAADWELNLFGKRRKGRPGDETEAHVNVFRMLVQPGDPQVLTDGSCEGGWTLLGMGGSSEAEGGVGPWLPVWKDLTRAAPCRGFVDHPEFGEAYYLDCWQRVGRGDEVARLNYDLRDTLLGSTTEKTTFVLRHTPRP
jgi:hypothetical protein